MAKAKAVDVDIDSIDSNKWKWNTKMPKELPDPEKVKHLTETLRYIKAPWKLVMTAYVFIAPLLSPYEHTLLWFIAGKTWGFTKRGQPLKTFDWINNVQIARGTCIPYRRIPSIKKTMIGKGILTKQGRKIGIERNFAKWKVPVTRGKHKGCDAVIVLWQEKGPYKGKMGWFTCSALRYIPHVDV